MYFNDYGSFEVNYVCVNICGVLICLCDMFTEQSYTVSDLEYAQDLIKVG